MILLHIGKGIEVTDLERDTQLLAELLAEMLVTIGLFATQMEVAVEGNEGVTEGMEDVEESYAVRPSAERYEERFGGGGDAALIGHELADKGEDICSWTRHCLCLC